MRFRNKSISDGRLLTASVRHAMSACLALVISGQAFANDLDSQYTPWGIDEYQLFGLTKAELSTRFKNKLSFSRDFDRAEFPHASRGYAGPVFNLYFKNDRVSSVQGVFEGCTQKYVRPRLDSKEAALNYAIKGLSSYTTKEERTKLGEAKQALSELKKTPEKSR